MFMMYLSNKHGQGFISGETEEESMDIKQRQLHEGDLTCAKEIDPALLNLWVFPIPALRDGDAL